MKDRVPTYAGRVTLTPVTGQANTYDMARADAPTQAGTPLNKASLLSDTTAAEIGLKDDPTNLFDAELAIDGKCYNDAGELVSNSAGQYIDYYIPIIDGETYSWANVGGTATAKSRFAIVPYTADKSIYVASGQTSARIRPYADFSPGIDEIIFDSDVKYVRLSYYNQHFPDGFEFFKALTAAEMATPDAAIAKTWTKAAAAKIQAEATDALLAARQLPAVGTYTGANDSQAAELTFAAPPVMVIVFDFSGNATSPLAVLTGDGGMRLFWNTPDYSGNAAVASTVSGNKLTIPGGSGLNIASRTYYYVAFMATA